MPISATDTAKDDRLTDYHAEFDSWYQRLKDWHTNRFDVNYKQYTAYADITGTQAKISDPVASELVERFVQKIFARDPEPHIMSLGADIPEEIKQVITATLKYMWNEPKTVQITGTARSRLKLAGREFGVTGNTGVETYFEGASNNPCFRIIPIEDIIFDPARTLKTSPAYYIRQYVSLAYLEQYKEVTEDGKVVGGMFKHLDELRIKYKDKQVTDKTDPNMTVARGGPTVMNTYVEDIELITRWEGKHCCRIADWEVIIQEYDNDVLDDDPLDFAMDITVPKQPYAYSMLDFIAGLTKAKDLFLNQAVDYGAKALNPPLFVDPNLAPASKLSLSNAYKTGGIVLALPNQADHKPMPPMPEIGFSFLSYIQQRSESVTGLGAYLSGVPNQTSDQTQGTKGGIEALIAQAQSPVQDRQINLEEALVEPIMTKYLKYAGALMGANEVKDIFVTGEGAHWIQVTKGLLTGKIALADLVTARLLDPEEAAAIAQDLLMQGKDPDTELIFDTSWIVGVETGSMAEADMAQDLEAFDGAIMAAETLEVPIDPVKIWKERATRAGLKEPEQYLLSPSDMMAPQMGQPNAMPSPGMPGPMMNSPMPQPSTMPGGGY